MTGSRSAWPFPTILCTRSSRSRECHPCRTLLETFQTLSHPLANVPNFSTISVAPYCKRSKLERVRVEVYLAPCKRSKMANRETYRQGHDEEFLDEIHREYECSICQLVYRNPVQLKDCGHCFCKDCIMRVHW